MSGSSCDCRQVYDISSSDDESPKDEDRELGEEEESKVGEETPEDVLLPNLREFFIGADEADLLEFNEFLFIRTKRTQEVVGRIWVFTEKYDEGKFSIGFRGEVALEKFHASYYIGLVDFNLEVLDQVKAEEHCCNHTGTSVTYSLNINYDKDEGIFNMAQHEERNGDKKLIAEYTKSREEYRFLLTVSAHILLLRQMARKDFVGRKYVRYLHLNSELCWAEYVSYPFEMIQLNRGFVRAKKIRRRAVMPNGELNSVTAYLTADGQLALMRWPGEPVYACVDREAELSRLVKDPAETLPLRVRIQEHPVLKSILMEEKERTVAEAERYAAQHPELRAIMSHVSKTLLLYKPHKVVHFVRRNIAPYL